MLVSWIFAALHLLALGIGLGALWARSRALSGLSTVEDVRRVLFADNMWGVAALLWVGTGLMRAFGSLEKGSDYYLSSGAFGLKMLLLAIILLLEVRPMLTFVRWRMQLARDQEVDTQRGREFARTSVIQAVLVVGMVFAATAMARGINP